MNIKDRILLKCLQDAVNKRPPNGIISSEDNNIDYYVTIVKNLDNDRDYILEETKGKIFSFKIQRNDDSEDSIKIEKNFDDIKKNKLVIYKYYKGFFWEYKSKLIFVASHLTKFYIAKYYEEKLLNEIKQKMFNNKRIDVESRIEVLKIIREENRKGRVLRQYKSYSPNIIEDTRSDPLLLLVKKYGGRIIRRPDLTHLTRELSLMIDSLEESGEIKKIGNILEVTGKGINTVVEHQKERKKEREEIFRQHVIISLTFVLAAVAALDFFVCQTH